MWHKVNVPIRTQNSTVVLERVALVLDIHIYPCEMSRGRFEVPDEIPVVLVVRHHVNVSIRRENAIVEPC